MQKFSKFLIATTLVGFNSLAFAGSVAGTGGATEVTQGFNLIQLEKQNEKMLEQAYKIKSDIDSLRNVAKNFDKLKDRQYALNTFHSLVDLYKKTQGFAYAGQNAAKEFEKAGQKGLSDLLKEYKLPELHANLLQQNQWQTESILKDSGLQIKWFENRFEEDKTINTLLNNAKGTEALMYAGSKIAQKQVESINQLIQLQTKQNTLIASKEQAEIIGKKKEEEELDNLKTVKGFKSGKGISLIELSKKELSKKQ